MADIVEQLYKMTEFRKPLKPSNPLSDTKLNELKVALDEWVRETNEGGK